MNTFPRITILTYVVLLLTAQGAVARCLEDLRDIDRRISVTTGRLQSSSASDIRRLRDAAKTLEQYRYDRACKIVTDSIAKILSRFEQKLAPARKLGQLPGELRKGRGAKQRAVSDPRNLSEERRIRFAKSAVSIFAGDSHFAMEQALGEPIFSIEKGQLLGQIRDIVLAPKPKLSFLVIQVSTIRNLKRAWVRMPLTGLAVYRPGTVYFIRNADNRIKDATHVYFNNGQWVINKRLQERQREQQQNR